MKHFETLLTNVGIPADEATKIAATPEDQNFDPKPVVEKIKTNYTTQLQNDPNFFNDLTLEKLPAEVKKKVESSQYGRAATIVREKFLKALGMSETDLADLPEDQREKLESFIPAAAEKYAKTKAGDKQLQQDLIEARKKLEEYNGFEEKIKTKYETESNNRIKTAVFNSVLVGELATIPGLKIAASDIAKTAHDILNNKYAFELSGDYGIELRQKANPQLKALKAGSSHEITLKDALLEIAKERGWMTDDDGGKSGGGRMKVEPTGGKLTIVPPHLQDKISKKIAAEQ